MKVSVPFLDSYLMQEHRRLSVSNYFEDEI